MPTVQAYWNRTRRLWSVRAGGLVVAYEAALALRECRLHAGESARLRCVRTGDRDVHAWIAGELADEACPEALVRIGYRPSAPGFRRRDTDQIITHADLVRFAPDGSAWALDPR